MKTPENVLSWVTREGGTRGNSAHCNPLFIWCVNAMPPKIQSYRSPNTAPKPMKNYQCERCELVNTSDSKPSANGCPNASSHRWNDLGLVGDQVYQCERCSIVLESAEKPPANGCSKGSSHRWNELGSVGSRNYQCERCGTVLKTDSKPSSNGCSSGSSHRWSEL